jgi:hypothetical protein
VFLILKLNVNLNASINKHPGAKVLLIFVSLGFNYFGPWIRLFWTQDQIILDPEQNYFGPRTQLFWTLDPIILVPGPDSKNLRSQIAWWLDHGPVSAGPSGFPKKHRGRSGFIVEHRQ